MNGDLGAGRRPQNGGNAVSAASAKKLQDLKNKIMIGDICFFNKKSVSIIIPLNTLAHNLIPNKQLDKQDYEYIYSQFVQPEKNFILQKTALATKIAYRNTVQGKIAVIEEFARDLYNTYSAWPFKDMLIEDCKVYDNEKLRMFLERIKEDNKDPNRHKLDKKGSSYATSDAIRFQGAREAATEYREVSCPVPNLSLFYTRIKNALRERIEMFKEFEAQEKNSKTVAQPNFIEKVPDYPHIKLLVNLEGIDFRIESMFTKMTDAEIEGTKARSFLTSQGQEIEVISKMRFYKEGLTANKIFNDKHYAIVEFIEQSAPLFNEEERMLGIIPTCLIKKYNSS